MPVTSTTRWRRDEQAAIQHLDVARRLRRRPRPERAGSSRQARRGAPRMGAPARSLARAARRRRRRGQRQHAGRRRLVGERRRSHHGPEHVRWRPRPLGRASVAGLVGRRPALPSPGLRAHAPRPRSAGAAGRHDVPLRHRRHRVRARAGQGRCRRQGRVARGWRERCPAVPGGRADRRDGDSDRSRLAGRRHADCSRTSATPAYSSTRFRRSRRPESCTSSTTSRARPRALRRTRRPRSGTPRR